MIIISIRRKNEGYILYDKFNNDNDNFYCLTEIHPFRRQWDNNKIKYVKNKRNYHLYIYVWRYSKIIK